MACCAFAVFFVSQLCFACQRVWSYASGRSVQDRSYENTVVGWSLSSTDSRDTGGVVLQRKWQMSWKYFWLGSVVLFLILGSLAVNEIVRDNQGYWLILDPAWCRSLKTALTS
jgi:hypothetical protein